MDQMCLALDCISGSGNDCDGGFYCVLMSFAVGDSFPFLGSFVLCSRGK